MSGASWECSAKQVLCIPQVSKCQDWYHFFFLQWRLENKLQGIFDKPVVKIHFHDIWCIYETGYLFTKSRTFTTPPYNNVNRTSPFPAVFTKLVVSPSRRSTSCIDHKFSVLGYRQLHMRIANLREKRK